MEPGKEQTSQEEEKQERANTEELIDAKQRILWEGKEQERGGNSKFRRRSLILDKVKQKPKWMRKLIYG